MGLIIVYGLTTVIALLLIIGYWKLIQDRKNWFVFLFVSVFVVNAGYLWLACSRVLESALMANRLAYFGSVFLPLCMLMIILNVCKVNYPKVLKYILLFISIIVFVVAASGGITEWYYEDVTLVFIKGSATLVKVYGPLHKLYYVYLFVYLLIMATAIIVQWVKKKAFELKHALLLLAIVFGNTMIWFAEQGIDTQFECLSVSYILTEVFLLMLYGILQDYDLSKKAEPGTVESLEHMSSEEIMKAYPQLNVLTSREMEVVIPMLHDKKRKEIAEELSVTEHTIKKHTAHIFAKLEVTNRKELHEKLGIK